MMSTNGTKSEFSTPVQSFSTSANFTSLSSFSSAYFTAPSGSALDMDSGMTSTDFPENAIRLDNFNERRDSEAFLKKDLYFSDGIKTIDFVLVSCIDPNDELALLHEERRKTFEKNLAEEDLILESEEITGIPLRFVKIHAPLIVCRRYAEILKFRLPMKEKVDGYFEKKRFVFHFPGLPPLQLSASFGLQDMHDSVSRLFNFVRIDKVFPPKNRQFTAIYSRDKEYLFDVNDDFFTSSTKARIVDFIIRRKKFKENTDDFSCGIEKLINDSTYVSAYPLHEGDLKGDNSRAILYRHWASLRNIYRYQPLDYIKDYFGVKIGLYFAWLGFYTYMLIPSSIVGFFCFIYAIATIDQHIPSNDICNETLNITMCPLCDKFCDFWNLEETCFHAKFTYLVDNPATVFFAVFMSFWAVLFLEMWKRYAAEITHRWNLTNFDIHEEHPRPQYLARLANVRKTTINVVTGSVEPRPPFWRMQVLVALVAVMGVILYRMSVLAALSLQGENVITSYAMLFTSTTAALINLCCIMIFNQIYARLAERLTDLELQRTQTEFDDSLTLKIYLLQFVNYYASIFYIAFFKGKMVGYPGNYNRVLNSRQEECSPGGCLLELSVQLAIIMVGKQAMNTVMEMIFPLIMRWYGMLTVPKQKREAHKYWPLWAKDFRLVDFDPRGLFPEYLEMILQYGFVTIFVSSFPLAPLFAFVNNVFEMRLDAQKLLTHYRRPVSQKVKDIGVWFRILDAIGKLAVITNAFIIAFTSNFIPEMVYQNVVSHNHSLEGFLNHSLSVFDVNDYPPEYPPPSNTNITVCRYSDYRRSPGLEDEYKYSEIFWHILAARFAFVVVFENVVFLIVTFIKSVIPDTPYRLQEQIRREAYITNELIVEQELHRARGSAVNENAGDSPRSPLRRQYSEPTKPSSNVHYRNVNKTTSSTFVEV